METSFSQVGGSTPSREEQQYEEDLKRAIEESLKTQKEEDRRRSFLGYDQPNCPRESLTSAAADSLKSSNGGLEGRGLNSPPDLMSFKFDHVLKNYSNNESEKLTKQQEGLRAASILRGRTSIGSSVGAGTSFGTPSHASSFVTSSSSSFRPMMPSSEESPPLPPRGQSTSSSHRSSWGDRLFQSPSLPPQGVQRNFQVPNSGASAIRTTETTVASNNPFGASFKEPLSPKSSSEMMDSLLHASLESFQADTSKGHRLSQTGNTNISSSFPKSSWTDSRVSSAPSSSNPFETKRLSYQPQQKESSKNLTVLDGSMRRISSQPSFPDFMANGWSTSMPSDLSGGTIKQSRSSDDFETNSGKSGSNLMHFSPAGQTSDEVFDFSYFDPLKSPDMKEDGSNDPLSTEANRGTTIEGEVQGEDMVEEETPPALPPRRPISFPAENSVVKAKAARTRSGHGGVSPTKSWVPSKVMKDVDPSKVFFGDGLYDINSLTDEEGVSFGRRVARIRREYSHLDQVTNPGHVIAPKFSSAPKEEFETSVKIVLYNPCSKDKPVMFTCDVNTSVQHIIIQAWCNTAEGSLDCHPDEYALKLPGRSEYLLNDSILGHYEYVLERRKFDQDVELVLVTQAEISSCLARTLQDDEQQIDITTFTNLIDTPITTTISRQGLDVLIDNFTSESDKVFVALNAQHNVIVEPLIQSVKVICTTLAKVETNAITQAIHRLEANITKSAVEALTKAVFELVDSYCQAFDTDFNKLTAEGQRPPKNGVKDISTKGKRLSVRLDSAHRLPRTWKSSYESFTITLQLYYSGQPIHEKAIESWPTKITTAFFDKLTFAHVIELPIPISQLPRESRLCFILYGIDASSQEKTALGWVLVPLFNYQSVLVSGSHLLGLWPNGKANPIGTCASNLLSMDSVILQVDFLNFKDELVFPSIEMMSASCVRDFRELDESDQSRLKRILQKGSVLKIDGGHGQFLWAKRHYCHHFKWALPQILSVAPTWDWASLPEIYSLLNSWTPLEPLQALQLLHPRFADQEIRYQAVKWMEPLTDDALCDFLPQLVQALKYENYHNSALVSFLLRRSLSSIRIAHYLFWYLQDTLQDEQFKQRAQLILGALLAICGNALRTELQKQKSLMEQLSKIADKVKSVKDVGRLPFLHKALEETPRDLTKNVRLPTCPGLEVNGFKTQACTYFQSFTVPLKLSFHNADILGDDITVMFKVGEDMRQDMLTMQMIRIMDKIWLSEGLDLRMVVFRCMPTGQGRGLVELVPNSETLRKIQVEHGVTGSFKDKPLALWLQKHNPTELEYEKAVENFTYSCAGYCVATYVLGVGDRHNDNIMITKTGHTFHVDFGKFLGNLQMFGNIKRDRTPFVLSSDMAYVINGGDKPTSRFHEFVDLCCEGFNLVRKHADIFLNLFGLMLNTGIAQLSKTEDLKYVQDALKPEATDAEATTMFTRFIEASLGSKATQINFFFHNLAQRNFSASSSTELSFAPKRHSIQTDGKIKSASIFGVQKRYEDEKYYVYIIRIVREGQSEDLPTFIFRRFSEFEELHQKLGILYPHVKLPSLSGHKAVGRTHIRQVAEKRSHELTGYVKHLLQLKEVSECDLVYTFFHPSLRDEKDAGQANQGEKVKAEDKKTNEVAQGQIGGQVKLSLYYQQNALFIVVSHAKDLPARGGSLPDPYVKTYLIPDPYKSTKKKTKVVKKTRNPTYNEVIMYKVTKEEAWHRTVRLTVWNSDLLKDHPYMGGVDIVLEQFDLNSKTTRWFLLGELPTYC
ncbi:Phosphatidylinositol 4-phosphate 3-kinase C2 domain-containing subunit beta [Holothuria leucospilota]|uniref:Phosphatidylinositol 4-phosphate 3-kinase C2 domain-containing subunit beta n=1 Tax=Holothuria leucospilota TaxID=206669 RepID=A0A9Q0YRI7_HOLLE|nr:Phosphatidylinositol 4-phosphate 3-kinase C2 domain-containing subunit beta [Holothuria leucospilota]